MQRNYNYPLRTSSVKQLVLDLLLFKSKEKKSTSNLVKKINKKKNSKQDKSSDEDEAEEEAEEDEEPKESEPKKPQPSAETKDIQPSKPINSKMSSYWKPLEALTATEKVELLKQEKLMMNIIQLMASFGGIYLTQTIFALDKLKSSPALIYLGRILFVYLGYLLLAHGYYYLMKYLITRKADHTLLSTTQLTSATSSFGSLWKKYVLNFKTSPLFLPMKMILGEGCLDVLDTVLGGGGAHKNNNNNNETSAMTVTVTAYDLQANLKVYRSMVWEVLAVSYLHLLCGQHRMLVALPVMGCMARLKTPLTLIYLLGFRSDLPGSLLSRPFKSAMEMMLHNVVQGSVGSVGSGITPVVTEEGEGEIEGSSDIGSDIGSDDDQNIIYDDDN